MLDCNGVSTPQVVGQNLDKGQGEVLEDPRMYRRGVAKLLYAVAFTRSDLAESASRLARYFNQPREIHWKALKHTLRYVKKTLSYRLMFDRGSSVVRDTVILTGYSDANHGSENDRKSTSGYVFYIGGCPISWKSKRQGMVTISSTEAELVALSEAGREAMWLMRLLRDLGLSVQTTLFEDNQGAIYMANGSGNHQRSKHIDIRDKYIQQPVDAKLMDIKHCRTQDMVADLLTKALPKEEVRKLTERLKLRDSSVSGSVEIGGRMTGPIGH